MADSPTLAVAKVIGRSEAAVIAYQDVTVDQIARDLALGPNAAALVAGLGTAPTAPPAPTGIVATIVDPTHVRVTFVQTADGGATPDSYLVTSAPGGFTATGTQSPVIVTAAFAQGQAYTFVAAGTSEYGTSPNSGLSNAVTPKP